MNIKITKDAKNKILKILSEEENVKLKLRIFITGGGCSGFQYGFTLDDNVQDSDFIIKDGKVEILIDHLSIQYLVEATLDYEENLIGSKFVIKNPNATVTCGCGSSFTI